MAIFDQAYSIVAKNEGGYANSSFDYGGETYKGISRRFNPTWAGWPVIDKIKLTRPIRTNEIIQDPQLDRWVKLFYEARFRSIFADKLNSQPLANILYDFHVLAGGNAIKLFQRTINNLLQPKTIVVDGAMGNQTVTAANSLDSATLHDNFKKAREAYHRSRVAEDASQLANLTGWLSRNNSFPDLKKKILISGGGIMLIGAAILGYKYLLKK